MRAIYAEYCHCKKGVYLVSHLPDKALPLYFNNEAKAIEAFIEHRVKAEKYYYTYDDERQYMFRYGAVHFNGKHILTVKK